MAPPPPQPTPPQSSSSSSAQTLQFLSNILSQRGPTSVPYTEDTKWLIRQHLISLTDAFPSLHIKTATFTHNDGRTSNLLQCDGTLPMLYQGVTYNIPVIIWLLELYPRHPPLVYVNPTRDMIIKRPHNHVTPSGMVNVRYLQDWVYPSYNLVDLARELSACFARDPPLYSQRKSSPVPNPGVGSSLSPSLSLGSSLGPSLNLGSSQSSITRPGFNSASRVNYPPYGGGRADYGPRTEDPNEVFKRNAVNKLVDMIHGDMVGMRKVREGEMDGMFAAQAALRGREERVLAGLKEMGDEKEALENQLQVVLTNVDVLEGWVKENAGKLERKGSGEEDVDEVFEAGDVLSRQMIEASASDLAIEDVIYSLDKAVQEGVVPFDQYLRSVRSLSREQFFQRALCVKVRGAQMQAHVASMASRSSQYAM